MLRRSRTTVRAGRARSCIGTAVRRACAAIEPLEMRQLLSVTLVGVPTWDELGASPQISAGSNSDPNNPASGAVEEVAVDPSNPARIFAGTVNGGIWATFNGDSLFDGVDNDGINGTDDAGEQPTWSPMTDFLGTLSIGDIRFDPSDATNNTLFAGTGSTSSLSTRGGPPIGVLRTANGGTSWSLTALSPGNEPRIRAVLPTTIDYSGDSGFQQVVFVGTVRANDGLYRSTDGGATYAEISGVNGLPNGAVTDLLADPNDPTLVYAGVVGQGVFFSDDGGDTWTATDNATLSAGSSTLVQLTAHPGGGTTVWYALVSDASPVAFTSSDGGTNWTPLAAVPAQMLSTNSGLYTSMAADQIVVDPGNSAVVYISKGYGGNPHMWRYDPSGAGSWVQLTGTADVGNSTPHVDNRDMKFAGNNLIAANDGGVYILNNPINPGGNRWRSFHGIGEAGLSVTEFTNVTWDSTFDVAYGGAQDNGTSVQNGFLDQVWTMFRGSDGGDAAVDTVNAGAGQVFRYSGTQPSQATPQFSPIQRHLFNSATGEIGGGVTLFPNAGLAGFTPYFVPLYELNKVDPARLVTGGSGTSAVYELTNAATAPNAAGANWVAVPLGAGFGAVNQNRDAPMVVGGRLGGADNAEVLIVGSGNRVFVRSTAGGTLTATPTNFPGTNVLNIAVDPENWQRMFVTDGTGVWSTPDAGTTWVDLTRNLADVNFALQSLAFVATGAGGVVLAGGNFGVSRLLLGVTDALWTRLGENLPNALVSDLEYHADDDVLVAGTFGRGAWLLQGAQTAVEAIGALIIEGDELFPGQDDVVRLVMDEFNSELLNVFINGVFQGGFLIDTLNQVMVNTLAGMDTLIMDSSFGLIRVLDGTRYNGGTEFDTLRLEQTGGDTQDSDVYSVGPGIGAGTSTVEGPSGVQTVYFTGLEPVIDLVPAALLAVNATPEHNAINYTQGSLVTRGLLTVDAYESIEFENKSELRVNALAGNDIFNLSNSSQPTGLGLISFFGNEGDDTATTLSGLPAAVSFSGTGGAGHDNLNASGAAGTVTLLGGDGNDTLIGGSGNDSINGAAGEDVLDGRAGTNTVNGGSEVDTVLVTGTAGADGIAITDGVGGAFNIAGTISGSNTLTSVENASVSLGAGADALAINLVGTSNGLSYSVTGGDPVAAPGDSLSLTTSQAVTYTPGPGADSGSFQAATSNPTSISFTQFEALSVGGGGSLTANGTGGDDAISIVAATGGLADGIQDFTLGVNASAGALFINTPSLNVNSLGGDDSITVRAPVAGVDWDVDLSFDAGPPTASDRVIVETPGTTSAFFTPSAANGGTVVIGGLVNDSTIALTDVEQFIYDGMSGNDSLSVNGTAGDDDFVHTPGSANDAGSIAVNSLLGVSYQNLGAGGLVSLGGLGGLNTLVAHGTNVGDAFSVTGGGTIGLNARVPLNTSGFSQVALEGMAGDDTFALAPDVAASPFLVLLFNGGGQASATGDRAFLFGTGGDDTFDLTGQSVFGGGNNVSSTGVENINLGMGGGSDTLIYTGVAGLQEAVNVIGSTTAGNGQLNVAGIANYIFTSAEIIFAHGQNDENDTLTVTGTNNVDHVNIDTRVGPGTGTAGTPVLQLQSNAAPASLLLTLADYTGFATLNVAGLDGADFFNVFTGPVGGRNLFLDGGLPAGKKKQTDKLTVFYEGKRPRIIHSVATQDPDSGLVDLDYTTSRTLVQYTGMETVVITK